MGGGGGGQMGQIPSQCFCKENKNTKNTKPLFSGRREIIREFFVFAGIFEPDLCENGGMSLLYQLYHLLKKK